MSTYHCMRIMCQYFGSFDGKTDWTVIEPLFEKLFHPNAQIQGKDTIHSRSEWKDQVKRMVEGGLVINVDALIKKDGHILLEGTLQLPDGKVLPMITRFIFQDEQMIRTQPVDRAIYDTIVSS